MGFEVTGRVCFVCGPIREHASTSYTFCFSWAIGMINHLDRGINVLDWVMFVWMFFGWPFLCVSAFQNLKDRIYGFRCVEYRFAGLDEYGEPAFSEVGGYWTTIGIFVAFVGMILLYKVYRWAEIGFKTERAQKLRVQNAEDSE